MVWQIFLEQFLYLNLFDWLALLGIGLNLGIVILIRKWLKSRKTKTQHQLFLRLVIAGLLLPTVVVGYSFFIEPNWLVTRTYSVDSSRIQLATPLRIVVIGDIQAKAYFTPSYLAHVAKRVNQLQPSYIVWVGDLFQEGNFEDEPSLRQLSQMIARDGKIAVLGNHDYRTHMTDPLDTSISDKAQQILTESGFTVLRNEAIETNSNELSISWAGTEDLWTEAVDFSLLNSSVAQLQPDLSFLVTHQPFTVKLNNDSDLYDLTFSGHCHGGQINLGRIGEVIGLPLVPPGCPQGTHQVQGLMTHYQHLILTTPGIGSLSIRARLMSRPQISLVEVY